MNRVEQVILALMIDNAVMSHRQKFSGTVSELRHQAVGDYRIDFIPGAFEAAFDFLVDYGLGKIHRHPPLEDYISIDLSAPEKQVLVKLLADETEEGFSFSGNGVPRYPVIASYQELGSDWLHDLAAAIGSEPLESNEVVSSASWTGRYDVSEQRQLELQQLLVRMRTQIEAAELSNAERANALAAIEAIYTLSSAPDPAWAIILKILGSPILANVAALAALAISLIKG